MVAALNPSYELRKRHEINQKVLDNIVRTRT
ncbi:hypothetical protein ACVWWG_006961 [Bradyrhizobium sp. LB7.2]